jgi:hypothetical protein
MQSPRNHTQEAEIYVIELLVCMKKKLYRESRFYTHSGI